MVRKIIRLFWLLFMNICAPFAVRLEINWLKAYRFIGDKNIKKLKKIRSQSSPSSLVIKELEDQTIQYFKKIVDQEPSFADQLNWINTSLELGSLYCSQGRMDEMDEIYKKNVEFRRKIAAAHQFDDLNIGFLPRNLATGSIGFYEYLDAYIKAGLLGLHPLKKLILLVDRKESINNPCYLNYWRRYVTVITDPALIQLLTPLEERLKIPLNYYIVLQGKIYKRFLTIGYVGEQWVKERRDPPLKLSDEDYQRGWQHLKMFGLNQNDWFVCFHVRESGWKDKDSRGNDFRDADIDSYQSAMKTVTDAGGWVFRMGDPNMKPLPEMPRVIDYAHSKAKSDWMDVFLCGQCRFFVTTSSGLHLFAITFGKPIVMTNSLPTCGIYFLTSKDLYIPKLLIKRRDGCPLNFSELFGEQRVFPIRGYVY